MLGGDVVLERGDVDEVLGEVGAEVDDLEGADDGIEAGEVESEGGEVDLLDFDAGGGVDGGEQGLKLFEALAVGVLLGGALEDEAEVLAEAALDGVVEREIEDAVGGFAGDDAAFEGVLRGLGAVLSGGVVELLLGGRRRGSCRLAVLGPLGCFCCAGPVDWAMRRDLTSGKEQARALTMEEHRQGAEALFCFDSYG